MFKLNYNNFSGKDDKNALKKIISEIPWFNDYKNEKIIRKNDTNYKKCLNGTELTNLMKLNDHQILSNLKILNIQLNYDNLVIKDIFPNLVKLKIKYGSISISYNLLKRIQILSLIDSEIETNKEEELLLLKRLKIVGEAKFIKNAENLCPNLEHLILIGDDRIVSNFFPYGIPKLYKIPLIFSKLMYCNIITGESLNVGLGMADEPYSEIYIQRYGKDLFKYETQNYIHQSREILHFIYSDDSEVFNHEEEREERDDYYIKKFYYSKKDKPKSNLSVNYEEIFKDKIGNEYKNNSLFFDLTKTQKETLKYLQYLGITIDKNNSSKINILVENLKDFLFLRGFCIFDREGFISKEDLLAIINNLSKLCLIENLKIETSNKDLNESEEKNILSCIEGIKILKKNNKTLIELNGGIFNNKYEIISKKLYNFH